MKYFIVLLYCGLLQMPWINFEPPEMGVRVYVPERMEAKVVELQTDLGTVELHNYSYQQKEDPGNIFMLNLNVYEDATFHQDSSILQREFLVSTLNELVDNINGIVDYSEHYEIQDSPALKYRISYNQNGTIAKGKMVLKKDVLYLVQVFTSSEKSLNDDMELYLNSFKILEE